MNLDQVKQKIARIGSEGYKDGSSIHKGWLYHPIPFPEFDNVNVHKHKPCFEEHSTMREYLSKKKITPKRILDIGCNVGFHSFKFEKEYDSKVVGIEADALVIDAARAVATYEKSQVEFIHGHVPRTLSDLSIDFNLTLFLNAHMWVYKQSSEGARDTMNWIFKNSEYCFFQTAHLESGGMFKVPLKTTKDVQEYLEDFGFKVDHVKDFTGHGGIRSMFFLES